MESARDESVNQHMGKADRTEGEVGERTETCKPELRDSGLSDRSSRSKAVAREVPEKQPPELEEGPRVMRYEACTEHKARLLGDKDLSCCRNFQVLK